MERTMTAPRPRPAVADAGLFRPDWTRGARRDSSKLWLDKNENGDPELLALTRRVLADLDPTAMCTYPDSAPLYHKLATRLGLAPANLLLTPGSDGAIRIVFETFVEPADTIVHTSPSFAMYAVYCQMYGAKAVTATYAPSPAGPTLTADRLIETIRAASPRIVCVPNPDSPTGSVFAPSDLRRIIEAAGARGAVILIDEAYFPFYEGTALPWVVEYPHLVVARTFSKAWGMAGIRSGFIGASPDLAKMMHRVRPMYEIGNVAVTMTEAMLDHEPAVQASVRRLNVGKRTFLDAMEQLGLRVLRCEGNFLHVAFGGHAAAVHEALAPIVLYRQDCNDPCLKGFSRFSATTPALFAPVIDRIREAVRAPKGVS